MVFDGAAREVVAHDLALLGWDVVGRVLLAERLVVDGEGEGVLFSEQGLLVHCLHN